MAGKPTASDEDLQRFYGEVENLHLVPLWNILARLAPPWAWHEHASAEGEEAVLFSIHDTPVLGALGLYREEAYEGNRGHQPVTGAFAWGEGCAAKGGRPRLGVARWR
ncbi:MAG: hypothetical protein ACE5JJ_06915 [Nitrospinota bacterium]